MSKGCFIPWPGDGKTCPSIVFPWSFLGKQVNPHCFLGLPSPGSTLVEQLIFRGSLLRVIWAHFPRWSKGVNNSSTVYVYTFFWIGIELFRDTLVDWLLWEVLLPRLGLGIILGPWEYYGLRIHRKTYQPTIIRWDRDGSVLFLHGSICADW